MSNHDTDIHPEFARFLQREEKETLLGQKGAVYWMYGLSGSGKSTIANAIERQLHEQGRMTTILDGDNLRTGVNNNLSFTDEDRLENVRRASEVAKLFASQGIITFVSVITPKKALREMAREIVGEDFHEIYVHASFETCAQRDVKGLYAKAAAGQVKNFTGKDSGFEIPDSPELLLNTEEASLEECVATLNNFINQQQNS